MIIMLAHKARRNKFSQIKKLKQSTILEILVGAAPLEWHVTDCSVTPPLPHGHAICHFRMAMCSWRPSEKRTTFDNQQPAKTELESVLAISYMYRALYGLM